MSSSPDRLTVVAEPDRARFSTVRNGYLLVTASVVNALVGLSFWLLAARLYPPAVVGVDAAVISAMMAVAALGQGNVMSALLRFVPSSGRDAARLVGRGYLTAVTGAALLAVVFVVGVPLWAPDLQAVLHHVAAGVAFVVASAVWAVFVVQDNVFVAVDRAVAVPLENLVFAVLKAALLPVGLLLAPRGGIWAAWSVAAGVSVVGATWFLRRRALPQFASVAPVGHRMPPLTEVLRFAGPDYVGALAWISATSLVPVLVLTLVGPDRSAAFALSWQMCLALYSVPVAFGLSLVAHGAAVTDAAARAHDLRRAVGHSLRLIVPVVVVLVVGAPLVLLPFRADYSTHGATTLRLLAASVVPHVIVALSVSQARVARRMRAVVVPLVVLAALVVGLTFLLVPMIGIAGAGVAWLVAQTVVATGVCIEHVSRSRVHVDPAAVRSTVERALQRRRAEGWQTGTTRGGVSDTVVVPLSLHGLDAMAKVATSSAGAQTLHREHATLARLHADPRLDAWRTLLPEVLAFAHDDTAPHLLTRRLAGTEASSWPIGRADVLQSNVAHCISELHQGTGHIRTLGDGDVARWVLEPMARIAAVWPDDRRMADAAVRLTGELGDALTGSWALVGTVHGDLHPGNVLIDPFGHVTGLVDWADADPAGLAALDITHWSLTAPARGRGGHLGRRVARRLAHADASLSSQAGIPDRVLVLLAWLHHVDRNLAKSPRYTTSRRWYVHAVEPVLVQVTP